MDCITGMHIVIFKENIDHEKDSVYKGNSFFTGAAGRTTTCAGAGWYWSDDHGHDSASAIASLCATALSGRRIYLDTRILGI